MKHSSEINLYKWQFMTEALLQYFFLTVDRKIQDLSLCVPFITKVISH